MSKSEIVVTIRVSPEWLAAIDVHAEERAVCGVRPPRVAVIRQALKAYITKPRAPPGRDGYRQTLLINFRLPIALLCDIDAYIGDCPVGRSAVIRWAVDAYLSGGNGEVEVHEGTKGAVDAVAE